jgi:hypothetical protein
MTTTVESGEEELEEPPFSPVAVSEMLKSFAKAVRAHQLYLPNNPMYTRALEGARESFGVLWQQTDNLELEITETQFKWAGRSVLEETERTNESIPWTFYKDGVRELKFQPGFESKDLGQLLDILQRVRKASAEGDDLLTLLWECEFDSLQYKYVELGGEGESDLEGMDSGDHRSHIVSPSSVEGGAAGLKSSVANMDDFDSTLYFLDDREIEYLQTEIKRDFSTDQRVPVLASLLDTFEQEIDPTVREEICGILDYFLLILLSTTQYRTAAYLLRESGVAADRAVDILQQQKQRLSDLSELLSDPAALGQLLQALEDTPLRPPQLELNELFMQLKPRALESILGWIGRSNNSELRILLENAASRLASTHTSELVRLIGSDDDVVVHEAIRRAAALKSPAAVPALGRLLAAEEPELRLAAVTALTEIASPGALQVLERAVADEDRDIRIASVRALGSRVAKPALPRIEAALKSPALRESNLTEKMAFFEAYGLLSGEAGIPLLESILHAKGFRAKKEETELRACAAMALGKISTPRAIESLQRAAADKDIIVRNAVSRAIRGVSA